MGNCIKSCWDDEKNGYSKIPEITNLPEIGYKLKLPVEFSKLYELGSLTGQGTTSSVYKVLRRGRNTVDDGPELACKVIDKSKITFGLDDEEANQLLIQLRKEAKILREISHPNIVSLYDFAESTTHLYFVEELLQGGELFDYLVHHGPLGEPLARQLLFGVFSAVAYLHERGIVHRDIKAENLLFFKRMDGEFSLKIIDFGFSTELRNDMTGTFLGTGGYIAPEIRQQKLYSTSVDDWALGVLVYCCMAARLPFPATMKPLSPVPAECSRALSLKFPDSEWSEVSAACKRLITLLLQVDPVKRMTATEALHDPWFQTEFARLKEKRNEVAARFPRPHGFNRSTHQQSQYVSKLQRQVELPEFSPVLRHSKSAFSFKGSNDGSHKAGSSKDNANTASSKSSAARVERSLVDHAASMALGAALSVSTASSSEGGDTDCSNSSEYTEVKVKAGAAGSRGLSPKSPLSYWAIASHSVAGHLLRSDAMI